jgi:NAD(P)-dependent dehydrogenase (short-subunit alcohol dehydrogenase family)
MAGVVLVTGASSGIGEASALALHASGWTVYAGARRVARMSALGAAGVRVLPLDVTDDDAMRETVKRIVGETGRIDALVNNAGYGSYGALEEVPLVEGRRQFDVNFFGVARLVQLVLPHMRARRSGRIVNVSSIGGRIHEPLGAWYHASKFALEGLSDCLRMELAPFGIHVVVIQPGAIRTAWGATARTSMLATSAVGAYAEQARAGAALLAAADGAGGSSPEVVARAVLHAASARRPRTRYVVGRGARVLLAARHWLPDRMMDAVMRVVGRAANGAG